MCMEKLQMVHQPKFKQGTYWGAINECALLCWFGLSTSITGHASCFISERPCVAQEMVILVCSGILSCSFAHIYLSSLRRVTFTWLKAIHTSLLQSCNCFLVFAVFPVTNNIYALCLHVFPLFPLSFTYLLLSPFLFF